MPLLDNRKLDREGVINGLIDGVGAPFGRASRRSFYEQLKHMESEVRFQKSKHEEQQFLVDLLAVASSYQWSLLAGSELNIVNSGRDLDEIGHHQSRRFFGEHEQVRAAPALQLIPRLRDQHIFTILKQLATGRVRP